MTATRTSWNGVRSAGEPDADGVPDPEPREGVEGKFKATLVARAKKREVMPDEDFHNIWLVLGNAKLGDSFPHYEVKFDSETRKYVCDCYLTQHGESRARKVCSHVLAVILYRKDHKPEAKSERSDIPGGDLVRSGGGAGSIPATPADLSPLAPDDPYLTPRGWDPPPEWLTEYRPHQWQAAHEIIDAYERGAKVVFLDAPTGSGKTAIADLVSRLLKQRAIYVCSGLDLQAQFLSDFPYAKVLKGRANYPTLSSRVDVTADDCNGNPGQDNCSWCEPMNQCPYRVAKMEAAFGQVGVLNTAYWLREANSQRPMFSRPVSAEDVLGGLVVVDECDTMENALMGYLEYAIYSGRERQLKVSAPKKGSHKPTIVQWMKGELADAVREAIANARQGKGGLEVARQVKRLQEFGRETLRVADEVEDDNWIRDNDAGPLVLKPVSVAPYGEKRVWRHGGRFLLMSATIISAEEMAESLGIEGEWAVVRVPMTFPKDQRPVHVVPVAEMKGGKDAGIQTGAWESMGTAIVRILSRHPEDRVLVHAVSYALSSHLAEQVRTLCVRPCFTYNSASERADALAGFRSHEASVLIAPSMDRGVDLKDDDCRVVVVAKVPFPYLGDKQVSARLHSPGGQAWYTVQTIRTLVQMTGRGVRHEDDWCESYVLDSVMLKQLWKKDKRLFPGWWAEAVDLKFPVRLLR